MLSIQELGDNHYYRYHFSKVAKLGYRKRPASPLATCHVLINSSQIKKHFLKEIIEIIKSLKEISNTKICPRKKTNIHVSDRLLHWLSDVSACFTCD